MPSKIVRVEITFDDGSNLIYDEVEQGIRISDIKVNYETPPFTKGEK